MKYLVWSLSIRFMAALAVGALFTSAAYAQRGGGGGGGHFGGAVPGTPLGAQQLITPGVPLSGAPGSPGSISPVIGGVNGNGALVGGPLNGGYYGSPGSISPGIGGVNGNGALVGGFLNGGVYGSPGSIISTGVGGVNGNGALVGGSLNGGVYGSPGSIISPGIGGVNGNGALVGGSLDGGRYGSPGSYSPTIGGVNGRGALVRGSLTSGSRGFQNGEFSSEEYNGKPLQVGPTPRPIVVGITGATFFPTSSGTETGTGENTIIVPPITNTFTPPVSIYNPAPLIVEAAEGSFQYSWW
jgi:hypothetical protein